MIYLPSQKTQSCLRVCEGASDPDFFVSHLPEDIEERSVIPAGVPEGRPKVDTGRGGGDPSALRARPPARRPNRRSVRGRQTMQPAWSNTTEQKRIQENTIDYNSNRIDLSEDQADARQETEDVLGISAW